jgi:GT2 family glycosyltransferase
MIATGEPAPAEFASTPEPNLVYAVLVLYGLSPEESPAFQSLCHVLRSACSGSTPFHALLLYDNSPSAHPLPESLPVGLPVRYRHDPTNPGLARPYQMALANAQAEGTPWLLLLDQDTVVTVAWLTEMLAVMWSQQGDGCVAAIVPRLLQDGVPLSPHSPMWHRGRPMDYTEGIKPPPLKVFNSGALLRVAALTACGGFPQEFPLDYLDHAVFHALEQRGGQIYLLAAPLEHQLSGKHLNVVEEFGHSPRLQATAAAESRFYRRFGTPYEKLRHTLQRGHWVLRLLLAAKPGEAVRLVRLTFGW